jgi:hypothetical protein
MICAHSILDFILLYLQLLEDSWLVNTKPVLVMQKQFTVELTMCLPQLMSPIVGVLVCWVLVPLTIKWIANGGLIPLFMWSVSIARPRYSWNISWQSSLSIRLIHECGDVSKMHFTKTGFPPHNFVDLNRVLHQTRYLRKGCYSATAITPVIRCISLEFMMSNMA